MSYQSTELPDTSGSVWTRFSRRRSPTSRSSRWTTPRRTTAARFSTSTPTRDPRVRVIHLERNVGLGRARNTGLDEATGDYVWFVDSDDLVAAGSFKAIAGKVAQTGADVILIDHARMYTSGRTKRSTLRRKFEASLDREEPFAAADWPLVLRPLHTAWSRIIRRYFLIGLGLRFSPGWYEDVSVVFPVTAAAERIAVLYRVCYLYRQRRHGSITHSHGDDRHFDMFDQYRAVFAEFDRLGIDDPGLREAMFDRMQWHYRWVLNESLPGAEVPPARVLRPDEHRLAPVPSDRPAGADRHRGRSASASPPGTGGPPTPRPESAGVRSVTSRPGATRPLGRSASPPGATRSRH